MIKRAIIEIGSTNTKCNIYNGSELVYSSNNTIEFKKNYNGLILDSDIDLLFKVIDEGLLHTSNIYLYGCSIFRDLSISELNRVNNIIFDKYGIKIKVVSQRDESLYTAIGAYKGIDYNDNICVFIGGGGSIELVFVNKGDIFDTKHYNFGVVDITKKYPSLSDDVPKCNFKEVYDYVSELIGSIDIKCDLLILAGGDHLYWYDNAKYKLLDNSIYSMDNQKYMITSIMNDEYDNDAFITSLDRIKSNSDNPVWFNYSRAMKATTNVIAHKVLASHIVPTKINMEEGLIVSLMKE